jgi:hypothetical protein
MAGWLGGAASLAMLLSVGDLMAKLHTVDLRQSISDFLAGESAMPLNLDVDQALLLARVGLLVTGAASAATLVFAVFAVRRDKSARIAMSVLAVPLLVCGVFVDPFLAGFIVAAAVLLWTGPARDWYAGRAPRPVARTSGPGAGGDTGPPTQDPFGQAPPSSAPHASAPSAPSSSTPSPYGSSYGDPTSAPAPGPHQPGPYQPGPYQPGPYQPGPYQPGSGLAPATARPRQVATACVITWATSALVVLMMAGTLLALQSGQVVQDMQTRIGDNPTLAQSGMSFADVVVMVRVMAVLMLLWALAAIVVAGFAFRRQNWARITLAVSAAVVALLGLASSISFPGFLLVSAAAVAAAVLLFNRQSSQWYAGADDQRLGQPPRQQPPTQPW